MTGRILIIEDDLDFAGQLKTVCESKGYSTGKTYGRSQVGETFRSF
jgi:DNA-binding response OmpR family regulator